MQRESAPVKGVLVPNLGSFLLDVLHGWHAYIQKRTVGACIHIYTHTDTDTDADTHTHTHRGVWSELDLADAR